MGSPPEPVEPAYRTLRLPWKHRQVLGVDLNCSESSRGSGLRAKWFTCPPQCHLQAARSHSLRPPHAPTALASKGPANGRLRDAVGAGQLCLRGALQRAYAGRCRFRKARARLMVRAFSSGGSFQGNTVISAFGASEAMSIETWSGCAVTSSGSTSIGVWHDFAKSRDTLYTKSGRMR